MIRLVTTPAAAAVVRGDWPEVVITELAPDTTPVSSARVATTAPRP